MKKKNYLMWCFSLLIIGVATIILAGSNIMGIELPDIAVRIIGIVDLIAFPVLAYTTIKKIKKDQN
ncbi:MAG: hypothetical protein K2J73_11165 [Oscillospiraceae bacterium]|nr:hypothetical protein [Oscillospiraceae bacterium]